MILLPGSEPEFFYGFLPDIHILSVGNQYYQF